MVRVKRKMTTHKNSTTQLSLNFDPDVRVKVTSVDQFSFKSSLNYFGSNLGLWPGLGLYQILERVTVLILLSDGLRGLRRMVRVF